MSQYTTKPENEAKRLKAFELYMGAASDGKRRSIRSIAMELGVALSSVQYWRDHDQWDGKVREVLIKTARSSELASSHAKLAVRDGLIDGLKALKQIIKEGSNRDKIAAVKELANIAVRLQAIDPSALGSTAESLEEWKDDLEIPAPVEEPKVDVGLDQ